ncbi:MAG: MOSC domain-containing protein [Gemmatimonadota bacterium]|nr:MOSC domain-containing protein [Gemmatimonadota bacterium]
MPGEPFLRELHVYPLKSAAGIPRERAGLDALGLAHDRRWMAVGADGTFLSQRTVPRLALVETVIEEGRLVLSAPGEGSVSIPLEPIGEGAVEATVWEDEVAAVPAGGEADRWLSDHLGFGARIVGLPASGSRAAGSHAPAARIGFADAYPLLLISEASLAALNERLAEPVPMDRFRPNLVVAACEPFEEDSWARFRIGEVELSSAGPCARCSTTTVDQATGEKGREPLRTLAGFRREGSKVLFGMNVAHEGAGELVAGALVEILEESRP